MQALTDAALAVQLPVKQGCSVLKILCVSLRGSEADEAISGLQHGDCFGKIRLAMTCHRRTEQPWASCCISVVVGRTQINADKTQIIAVFY
jgi:hypothetical protein